MNMKRILIPTDFSENAGDALSYALNIIGKGKAHIHIVNVVVPEYNTGTIEVPLQEFNSIKYQEAKDALKALEEFGHAFYGEEGKARIHISTELMVGAVGPSLKEEAKNFKADMIIMGTQGVSHSAVEKMIGTISADTISNAPCPVILVPHGYKFKPIDNIIFATNLNHSDPYELWKATELIKPNVPLIRCVYVIKSEKDKENEELQRFAKYMIEHSPSLKTYFNIEVSDDIEKVLNEYAENYDAEMIVMHRSKKTVLQNLFGVRHTKKMLYWINVPLLIIN
jgi:nucleotide-binding universal stress UspA family protein